MTGLTLFAFISTHLLNHALGLISLDAQEAGRTVFLGVWRSLPGATVLLISAALHLTIVLSRQVRRSTLRMPAWELIRLSLGLTALFFVIFHGLETYGMNLRHGLKDTYYYMLLYVWPDAWWRQTILVTAAWTHGCMGIHYWLRFRPGYRRWLPLLYALALLLPVLAWLGAWAGAEDAAALARMGRATTGAPAYESGAPDASEAGYGSGAAAPRAPGGARRGEVEICLFGYDESRGIERLDPLGLRDRRNVQTVGLILSALVVLGVFASRGLVQRYRRRRGVVRVHYPDDRQAIIPIGATVLEASRSAGIPHASACGGQGRCTTCRVRIDAGGALLHAPGEIEQRALTRIRAPGSVRLACQIRPRHDLTVTPLVVPEATSVGGRLSRRHQFGAEQEIAVLFADLRGFTSLSENQPAFDVVYLLNQYFQAMGAAIEGEGGYLDKFIGDGIMALFGVYSGPERGCREALAAARTMATRLDTLNRHLAPERERPLRMGIGVHAGPAIVGQMGYRQASSLTAIGDTINVASRLESATKEHGVQLIVSAAVAERAGAALDAFERRAIPIRGLRAQLDVFLIPSALDLPDPRAAAPRGPAAEPSAGR